MGYERDGSEEELPPDFVEANAWGDALWSALKTPFFLCFKCEKPWKGVVCECGWDEPPEGWDERPKPEASRGEEGL